MMKQLHELQGNECRMKGVTGGKLASYWSLSILEWVRLAPAAIVLNGSQQNSGIPFL